jgi:hypothetical protein
MNEKGIENAEQDREDKKFRGKEEISWLRYTTFKSSATLSWVIKNIIPNISKDGGGIIFRIHQYKKILLINIRSHLPISTTYYPRRLEYSANSCENINSRLTFQHSFICKFPVQPNCITVSGHTKLHRLGFIHTHVRSRRLFILWRWVHPDKLWSILDLQEFTDMSLFS